VSDCRRPLADPSYLQVAAEHAARLKSQSRDALGLLPGAAVLDVGCGLGSDVQAMAASSTCRAVGVDTDPRMLAAARSATAPDTSVAFICANATRLPFPDGAFDAVRSERMLQHLSDPARAVCEMARVTRPGGRLVLIDTDWSSLTIDGTGDPATEQLLTEFLTQQAAASPTAGKDLPDYAARANLQVLRVFPTAFTTGNAALLRLIAFLDVAEDAALAAGQLDAVGLAAWRSRLASASHRGSLSCSLTLTMVIAVR
jgi:ubiquinone/menaquinone biosynthesis C-methylase UbiE